MSASARAHHNLILALKCVFALINVPNPGADDIYWWWWTYNYTGVDISRYDDKWQQETIYNIIAEDLLEELKTW